MSVRAIEFPCEQCGHGPRCHVFDHHRMAEFEGVPWDDRPFPCLGEGGKPCSLECATFVGTPVQFVEVER